MDLCFLTDIKAKVGIADNEPEHDDMLKHLIRSVSLHFEAATNRRFYRMSRTEYFNVDDGQTIFSLVAYPISAITSVKNDIDWDWASSSMISSDNYTYITETGVLYVKNVYLVHGFRALQVVYTGGLAADSNLLRYQYEDICLAAEDQVIAWFNNRKHHGVQSVAVGPNQLTVQEAKLLPHVKEVLARYKRPVV